MPVAPELFEWQRDLDTTKMYFSSYVSLVQDEFCSEAGMAMHEQTQTLA